MTRNYHLYFLCIFLTIVGFSIFVYKVESLHWPLLPDSETTVWNIEAQATFVVPQNQTLKTTLNIFPNQNNFKLIDENIILPSDYGSDILRQDALPNRTVEIYKRRAVGTQTLYYRAKIYQTDDQTSTPVNSGPLFPNGLVYQGAKSLAAENLIDQIRARTVDTISVVTQVVQSLQDTNDNNVQLLLERNLSPENKAQVAANVLTGFKVPTRLVHGFQLSKENTHQGDMATKTLLSYYADSKWYYIDPESAISGLPQDFVIWWYGDSPVFEIIEGGVQPRVTFSSRNSLFNSLEIASDTTAQLNTPFWTFSLLSLPVKTQQLYNILIMIPIGALVILLLRNIIGLVTFGTFMPVLIALAFRETQLINGIVMFVVIVTLGLTIRFYLEHLKLLLIPRIATVLTVVVIMMIMLSVLSHHLNFSSGLSIALFPMVILTMTIERMSIVWEERGSWDAIAQAVGSIIAAIISYLVMTQPFLEHLFFVFPELLLILLAVMILLGRYQGYRLSELIRFSNLFTHLRKTSKPTLPPGTSPHKD